MEKAAHPPEQHDAAHPQPVPRDPDLPSVSDGALMFFAAGALIVTVLVLAIVVD